MQTRGGLTGRWPEGSLSLWFLWGHIGSVQPGGAITVRSIERGHPIMAGVPVSTTRVCVLQFWNDTVYGRSSLSGFKVKNQPAQGKKGMANMMPPRHEDTCPYCRDYSHPFVCHCGFRCDVLGHIHAPCDSEATRKVHNHRGDCKPGFPKP